MTTRAKDMQNLIRRYRHEMGKSEVNMKEVARFALKHGWKLPAPIDPLDRLASEFAEAAKEETRHDKNTGQPYRANHAVPFMQGDIQYHLWVDIDEAPRHLINRSLTARREQILGDSLQLTLDSNHWNNIHPEEEPI